MSEEEITKIILFPNSCSLILCERTLSCLLLNPTHTQRGSVILLFGGTKGERAEHSSVYSSTLPFGICLSQGDHDICFLPQIDFGKMKADIGQVKHHNYGKMESFR